MIDTHCHLDFNQFNNDQKEVIEKTLRELDVLVNVGSGLEASQKTIALSRKYGKIYAAVGIHPHDTEPKRSSPETAGNEDGIEYQVEKLRELMQMSDQIVAIGETGLDYSKAPNQNGTGQAPPGEKDRTKAEQGALFKAHIVLAKEFNLPLVIHSRDAIEETLGILQESKAPQAVFHCFSYNKEWAQKVLDAGYLVSFTGIVTFKNARTIQEAAKFVPLDKIMVETDAPFLAPEPYRGQRCEPWMVKYVVEKIAELKNVSVEEVETQTDNNARAFFKIRAPF
ncbi:TatD family hydrolase [Patescibacteria group bacterium]|nr:TatD family hydrolase [Patescibacteria group bacterium]